MKNPNEQPRWSVRICDSTTFALVEDVKYFGSPIEAHGYGRTVEAMKPGTRFYTVEEA